MQHQQYLFDKEDYNASLDYYEKLEKAAGNDANKLIALKGQLRSAYQAGDAQKTIIAAGKINKFKNIPEETCQRSNIYECKSKLQS